MAVTFYRIVRTNPPERWDFLSHRERGIPIFSEDPAVLRLAEGISVTETFEQARQLAHAMPALGAFIAALVLPENAPVTFEPSGRNRRRGHFTVWGDPDYLLARVSDVKSVD